MSLFAHLRYLSTEFHRKHVARAHFATRRHEEVAVSLISWLGQELPRHFGERAQRNHDLRVAWILALLSWVEPAHQVHVCSVAGNCHD